MEPSTTSAQLVRSSRLRADVAIYPAAEGPVLRVGDAHHDVRLEDHEVDALLDALLADHAPTAPRARAALASLVEAGLADPRPTSVAVTGDGSLASAVRGALGRMGVETSSGAAAATVHALDGDTLPDDLGGAACWVSGRHVLLSPPAVPARDVVARHRAATLHHDADDRFAPLAGARGIRSALDPLAGPGLELAAVLVAAELLRPDRAPYEVLAIDLVGLTASRHPVLPVPPAPR